MLTNFSRELELVDRLETDYLRILYYDFPQKFSGVYKSYEYNRFCTIIEGEKHISVNSGNAFTYDNNQFILLPPESDVQMTINVPTQCLVFELNNHLLKSVCEKICVRCEIDYNSLTEDRLFLGKESPEIKDILTKMFGILSKSGKDTEFLLDLNAQELVYNLIQMKGAHQVLNLEYDNPVHKAVKFMRDHCMEQLSIKRLATDLNMSEASFCQYFKKITGIAPKEYLTNLKLSKAKDLLKHTNVTEVAFDLGYENISHFIALFKSKYSITPKQFQKKFESEVQ